MFSSHFLQWLVKEALTRRAQYGSVSQAVAALQYHQHYPPLNKQPPAYVFDTINKIQVLAISLWAIYYSYYFIYIYIFFFEGLYLFILFYFFWDASRLFWFRGLLDNISIRYMRSFSCQTKYTGEFWKAYTKMVYRIMNLFFYI